MPGLFRLYLCSHEVSQHQSDRSGLALMAVHQHSRPPGLGLLNERVRLLEVRGDVYLLLIPDWAAQAPEETQGKSLTRPLRTL